MPLVDPPANKFEHTILPSLPVISGPASHKPKIAATGKTVNNIASPNWIGLLEDERIKDVAIATLRGYGLSPCGPPGFYGTLGQLSPLAKTPCPRLTVLLFFASRCSYSAGERYRPFHRHRICHRLLPILLYHHLGHPSIRKKRRRRRSGQVGQLCCAKGTPDLSMHRQVV
jgi:hypothetical protein